MDRILRLNRTIAASVTRPADTNAYTAGDVISDSTSAPTLIKFPNISKDINGCAVINQAICVSSANQTTKPDLELWLFDTAPGAENDNGAFAPTDAEVLTCVAVIAFPVASFKVGLSGAGASGNVICDLQGLGIPVNTIGAGNALFGILVVRNTYTPISAEIFSFRLKVLD